MLPVMFQNSWMPTVFEDFFNNDWMRRVGINDEGNLTIAIENKQEHKHEDSHRHYLRREFSYSNYEQNYVLPDDVVRDKISAKVEDGILTITMPKTEPKEKVTKAIEVS